MSVPLVTIAIPALNAGNTIVDALACAFGQTHDSVEVVLADNGSVDDTVARARRFAEEMEVPLTVVTCAERGPGPARNEALRHARGEYIAWLDADDLIHPEKVRTQLALLSRFSGKPAIATCDVATTSTLPSEAPFHIAHGGAAEGTRLDALLGFCGIQTSAHLLTRAAAELLSEDGGFVAVRCQDREYFTRSRLLDIPYVHVSKILTVYRRHGPLQVTNTLPRRLWADAVGVGYRRLQEVVASRNVPLDARERAALERRWDLLKWRPLPDDEQLESHLGARGAALARIAHAASVHLPPACLEHLAMTTCTTNPQLFRAYFDLCQALERVAEAGWLAADAAHE